ncbi:CLUMA_CG014839, isoform A [Clunio marinus]|uniref:CLUMA_CG014839, isoform A n=1 Tax=Clunio marinus TaxID=568069 RepID=A0A1J1IPD7_9DIPT|nr:CLUMA_CG014839, isoform A [Clunio marinus]
MTKTENFHQQKRAGWQASLNNIGITLLTGAYYVLKAMFHFTPQFYQAFEKHNKSSINTIV